MIAGYTVGAVGHKLIMFNPVKNTMWPTACAQNFGDRSTRHILNYVKSRRNDTRNLTKIKVNYIKHYCVCRLIIN